MSPRAVVVRGHCLLVSGCKRPLSLRQWLLEATVASGSGC